MQLKYQIFISESSKKFKHSPNKDRFSEGFIHARNYLAPTSELEVNVALGFTCENSNACKQYGKNGISQCEDHSTKFIIQHSHPSPSDDIAAFQNCHLSTNELDVRQSRSDHKGKQMGQNFA